MSDRPVRLPVRFASDTAAREDTPSMLPAYTAFSNLMAGWHTASDWAQGGR
jgi:hypothetical protein